MSAKQGLTSSEEPEWSKVNRKRADLPFYVPSIDKYLVPEVSEILLPTVFVRTYKMPRADLSA